MTDFIGRARAILAGKAETNHSSIIIIILLEVSSPNTVKGAKRTATMKSVPIQKITAEPTVGNKIPRDIAEITL